MQVHIKGNRYGIPNWVYFLLAIINRLQDATSKEKIGNWASKTVLPDILGFDPSKLNSKSFWYATSVPKIVSEENRAAVASLVLSYATAEVFGQPKYKYDPLGTQRWPPFGSDSLSLEPDANEGNGVWVNFDLGRKTLVICSKLLRDQPKCRSKAPFPAS